MRPLRTLLGCVWLIVFIQATPKLQAQVCQGSSAIGFAAGSATINASRNCQNLFWCHAPLPSSVDFRVMPPGCDPMEEICTVRAVVASEFPGNHNNTLGIGFFDSPVKLLWEDANNNFVGACGNAGARIQVDDGETWIERPFKCGDSGGGQVYELQITVCDGVSGCEQNRSVFVDLTDGALDPAVCPRPPEDDCDENCLACRTTDSGAGGGGASAAGGGGHGGGVGTGPGAFLRYKAGSVGRDDLPGSPGPGLARFWSHSYAMRLFEDDDPAPHASRVYLVTETAVYRTFIDDDGDDNYEQVFPGDEYRRLTPTVSGWTLTDLDGTVDTFDADGLWLQRADRNGNTMQATYTSQSLTSVSFADGRREDFAYDVGGMLESITEVGVDDVATRTWSYTWASDDLTRIDRPDGTALEYRYDDPAHPGHMTRTTLIASGGTSERITAAWEYDSEGNVVKLWRGAAAFDDGIDQWQFAFDNPMLPTVTTITDPLGTVSTTTWDGRDAVERKPRVVQVNGDCPACGVGPNSQLVYDDPVNPYRVTEEVDGRGHITRFTYDGNGRTTSRIEAFGSPFERETTWTYDSTFPAFVATIEQPSTAGFPNVKTTTHGYDAFGNRTSQMLAGFEAGAAFSYETVFAYNAGGQVTSIDPPGYGTNDQTTYAYDPTRGNGFLVLLSRTDPLIGATTFGNDAFNRRISVTDPNGVVTDTQFDALDRVRFIIQRGAVPADDLVTEHRYNVFGDLFQTILPEGNVIEYGYDAAGRLTTIERKVDDQASSHVERVVYTFDGAGNRVLEEHERWTGTDWEKRSQTAFQYDNRCQLAQLTQGFGGDEAVTEYAYDCEGSLDRMWDANHPSGDQVNPASTEYTYDELDRLTAVSQPWGGVGGGTTVVTYEYDVQDHLAQVTDGEGGVTSYVYSDRDLMTMETSEVSGATTHTYNEHGEANSRTDARGVTLIRTIDALDRVTLQDYPGTALDVVTIYDDPAVDFSLGRPTRIERDGHAVDYAYDRFGRMLQDGSLTYAYEKNGNRTTIGYPGSVSVSYTYDAVDRQATMTLQRPGKPDLGIVTASSYEPSGPLASVTIGNGLVETRGYDTRYVPASIQVGAVLDWQYATDAVGNITGITDALNAANDRSYVYQDVQYYLTQGDGPWGDLGWTYDRLGNRLTETRDGVVDTYTYVANAAMGNSARLESIALDASGPHAFTYDAAGNQTQVDAAGNVIDRTYDAASRMARQERATASASTDLLYDGRSFLRRSTGIAPDAGSGVFCDGFESGDISVWGGVGTCPATPSLTISEPTYDSDGLLHRVIHPGEASYVLYFAGRSVAQFDTGGSFFYLTTDHLGSPVLATDTSGAVNWGGGFEPFGSDYAGASGAGVFLRFPGQWDDASWAESGMGGEVVYNVHRWYGRLIGRYTRTDPINLGLLGSANHPPDLAVDSVDAYYLAMYRTGNPDHEQPYVYAAGNPLTYYDPLGLFGPGALARAGGACVAVDGPLTVGDVIGVPLLIGAAVWAAADVITDWWSNVDECRNCSPDPCDAQYTADSEICRKQSTRHLRALCWAKAAERYGNCIAGRPVQPLFPLK